MLSWLALVAVAAAPDAAPLRLVQTIPLPGVSKRIDHLAVDVPGQRLFVAALGNGTLEVVDLRAGARAKSVPGLSEPQGVGYLADAGRVIVAAAGGSVHTFDARTFQQLSTMRGLDDADNVRIDAAAGRVWIGYGSGALLALDAASGKRVAMLPLPGHPESFRLESGGSRTYVNIPTAKQVAVVDRAAPKVIATWPLPKYQKNYPMALDEKDQRLFVGARAPATLVVLDTASGKQVAAVRCVGDTDDLFYDADRRRVYVIGGEGFVDVFDQRDPDHYARAAHLATAPGARTGLWVPELNRLYVAARDQGGKPASILVLEAR